ncbi:unnamed protein product [Protopolystoma xenopodis]|uniref:Uncharacterized protein n=1 Tax=Protopolystoma xenopodis TaxID=117903 RepID=A0A3S4ZJ67_9PLAT|nr:unnamed protein product [Protopolystoma xenopodis]
MGKSIGRNRGRPQAHKDQRVGKPTLKIGFWHASPNRLVPARLRGGWVEFAVEVTNGAQHNNRSGQSVQTGEPVGIR